MLLTAHIQLLVRYSMYTVSQKTTLNLVTFRSILKVLSCTDSLCITDSNVCLTSTVLLQLPCEI